MPDDLTIVALRLHAAVTWFLVGLIVFVQLVHYPLFRFASRDAFVEFEREHQRRVTWIVGPAMLLELSLALALVFLARRDGSPPTLPLIGLALVALIWASTFFIQIPLHARLEKGYDAPACRSLVRTNLLRVAAWTARGVIALMLIR